MALAAPAASVPPTSVASTSHAKVTGSRVGVKRQARTMAGTVVMSSSSMIRGFVRAM